MRRPKIGFVWCHVDRLDREDGKVWAVQWRDGRRHRYECFRMLFIRANGYTQFFGPKAKQPKAVIEIADGHVVIEDDRAFIYGGD